ncbi:type-2 ice-structuring protein-like [Perca flavescens]|uniref:type-2 ice-structuring protein-like n=1 Tax=Perca flavescens TaxID=8167 RepID=UPI00106EE721|nr:type-2 ice-structuring protein-like [Perca flavescens]
MVNFEVFVFCFTFTLWTVFVPFSTALQTDLKAPRHGTTKKRRRGYSAAAITFTMKTLTLFALVCVMTALTGAAADVTLVKRGTRGGCSRGWTRLNGRCFIYVPSPMTWVKAEKNCVSMGGNLVSVHNIMEYDELQKLIKAKSHEDKLTWIGGSDAVEKSQWLWSDGTPFHFTHWCRGEPNNLWGWQNCLQMNFGAQKCWDDMQCSHDRPSVCVKKTRRCVV